MHLKNSDSIDGLKNSVVDFKNPILLLHSGGAVEQGRRRTRRVGLPEIVHVPQLRRRRTLTAVSRWRRPRLTRRSTKAQILRTLLVHRADAVRRRRLGLADKFSRLGKVPFLKVVLGQVFAGKWTATSGLSLKGIAVGRGIKVDGRRDGRDGAIAAAVSRRTWDVRLSKVSGVHRRRPFKFHRQRRRSVVDERFEFDVVRRRKRLLRRIRIVGRASTFVDFCRVRHESVKSCRDFVLPLLLLTVVGMVCKINRFPNKNFIYKLALVPLLQTFFPTRKCQPILFCAIVVGRKYK